MRRSTVVRGCLAALLAAPLSLPAAPTPADAAWTALREGGRVALVRHALAPGVGDPPGLRLDDCSTQRNLDDAGRAQARAAGARLKRERVHVARLLSSPWCRCKETADLMDVGRVRVAPEFSNAFETVAATEARLDVARRMMLSWRGPGTLLIVTHGATIRALVGGVNPATAEAVVVGPAEDGTLREIGRVQLAPEQADAAAGAPPGTHPGTGK